MDKFQEEFLDKVGSDEILDRVNKQQKLTEVIYYALLTMKGNKNMSPLLALQIAEEDWNV